MTNPGTSPDAVVIGAGIVGAACAASLAAAGLAVTVIDRGTILSGASASGEGNILVSDKPPGGELELAKLSARLWRDWSEEIGRDAIEYEPKGGVIVAASLDALARVHEAAEAQRAAGVQAVDLTDADARQLEPLLAREVVGGAWYPEDAQVQPMRATAHLLRAARARGARVITGVEVVDILRGSDGAAAGVRTSDSELPRIAAGLVLNAAGPWAGQVAQNAGVPIPVAPRRGFVLVTEPLPLVVRHKVYSAEYLANVASGAEGLETSVVVEATRAGTILIGASRERIGFDRSIPLPVIRRLARQACGVFPFLTGVAATRVYLGFRPFTPDHLPIIGPDPRTPHLLHATGHEGAGIGLSLGTARLVMQLATGQVPDLDVNAFSPSRFAA